MDFWLNDLGFGAPMPLGDPLMFHPVFGPLVAFTSLRVTLSAVWLVHVVAMVVYFLRLAAAMGIRQPWLRAATRGLLRHVSAVALYFYDSDWIQMAITWTLYRSSCFICARRYWARRASISGERRCGSDYCSAFDPTHTLDTPLLIPVLAVYVIVAAPLDRRVYLPERRRGALPRSRRFASSLCCGGTAFPASASAVRSGTAIHSYGSAFLAPLVQFGGRSPFIGFGVGAAALGSVAWLPRIRDSHVRGCVAAFVASVAFNVTSGDLWNRILPAVGPWLFRDPMVFFGLLAGGSVLQTMLRTPRPAFRYGAVMLLLLQILQQAYVLPWPTPWSVRRGNLMFYRYQGHPFGLGRVLVDEAKRGPRVSFT
jgi:hypothetical protein